MTSLLPPSVSNRRIVAAAPPYRRQERVPRLAARAGISLCNDYPAGMQ